MDRVTFGVMCILFNDIGVPCFMQGKAKVKTGIWRIVLGAITFGVIAVINFVKGIILGVKVLRMTDEEFAQQQYTLDSGVPKAKN